MHDNPPPTSLKTSFDPMARPGIWKKSAPGPHGEQWMCGSFRMWAQRSLRQHNLRDEIFKGLSSFSIAV